MPGDRHQLGWRRGHTFKQTGAPQFTPVLGTPRQLPKVRPGINPDYVSQMNH